MEMETIPRLNLLYPIPCRLSSISGDHSPSSPRREQWQLGDEGDLGVSSQQWPCGKALEGELRVQDHPYAQPRWCHQRQVCHLLGVLWPTTALELLLNNPLLSIQGGIVAEALAFSRAFPWALLSETTNSVPSMHSCACVLVFLWIDICEHTNIG